MSQTTDKNNTTELFVVAGKNAIVDEIKSSMGRCPYYGTTEILDDVLFQKESWGGKRVPENTTRLSASANVEYVNWAKAQGVESGKSTGYYQELFTAFLASPKPEITEKQRRILALKALVAMRIAFLDERLAMEKRISNRGKDLDIYYPIVRANRVKVLENFRAENEPLLEEVQDGLSWQNLIGYATAQMGYTQKSVIEIEIKKMIEGFKVWELFGNHIPGFGAWTCAYFVAKLQDPKRFSDSGKVRAFAGMAPKEGKPMKAKRGEQMNYDPGMKEMLCKIFPESFIKVAGKFPDEPYARFLQECRAKQAKKALETTCEQLALKYNVPLENVTRLGFEEREDGNKVFAGFKIKKEGVEEPITTLNPGHVFQRALREFGSMFISDFYHVWLFLEGENPRIEGNPRIMAVLEKAKAKKKA